MYLEFTILRKETVDDPLELSKSILIASQFLVTLREKLQIVIKVCLKL